MFYQEEKENESTQENNALESKLLVEPTNQKPRRSVLKEFDPFAPNSPCPPIPKTKNQPVTIDEGEVYEDAETSLTSYLCPRNKTAEGNSETFKTPNKFSNGHRESVLIPGLVDSPQIINPNDTADLSYTDAIENHSQVDEIFANDKTSSEEDHEFNTNIRPIIPELTNQYSENNSLNVTTDLGKTLVVDKSNAMVDSLEDTTTGFNQMETETENADSLLALNKTQPSEISVQKSSVDVTENVIQELNSNMVDSLELPKPHINEPELDTTTLVRHNDPIQGTLVDSLEISKTSEKNEVTVTSVANQGETSDSLEVTNTSEKTEITSTPCPEETLTNEIPRNQQLMNKSTENFSEKECSEKARLNSTFEASDSLEVQNTSKNIEITSAPYPEETLADEVPINQQLVNKSTENINKKECSEKSRLNCTFDELPNTNEIQDENNIETNPELHKTFEGSLNTTIDEFSKKSQLSSIENGNKISEISNVDQKDTNNTLHTLKAEAILQLSNKTNDGIEKPENITTLQADSPKEAVNTLDSQEKGIEVEKESPATTNGIMNDTFKAAECTSVIKTKPDQLSAEDDATQNESSTNIKDNQLKESADINKDTDKLDLNKTFESCSKITEDNGECNPEIETTGLKQASTQLFEKDNYDTENTSLSLKDIGVGNDKFEAMAEEVEKTASNSPKNSVGSSETKVNSTLSLEEEAAESSRVMNAMAQSLNQTIDIEESAIVDDINSTNTSDETSQEKLMNITVENIKGDVGNQEPETENNVATENEERTENNKSNKVVGRKETEEFEDLEKQYNENAQNSGKFAKEPVVSYENIEPVIEKEAVVEQDHSKAYFRQDTREFEQLEKEFKENGQNSNFPDPQKISDGKPIENICDLDEKKKKCEENIEIQNKSKVTNYQEKFGNDELKGEYIANEEMTKKVDDLKKVDKQLNVSQKAELSEKTGHVKVRVSGNMCNANSVVENLVQIENTDGAEEPDTEISIKPNLTSEKEKSRLPNLEQTDIDIETQNAGDVIRNNTKTDEDVPICKINQNSTMTKSDEQQEVCDNSTKPKNRVGCRPNIRSMRNKTQVIDAPVFIKDGNKEANSSSNGGDNTLVPNDKMDEELIKYKSKSIELKNQVDELQSEKDSLKKENMRKDKYILTCALEIQVERELVTRYKKVAEEYQRLMADQCEELRKLKEESEKSAKNFTSLEMAFADLFAKYEQAKATIDAYTKNEAILQKNIESAEDQLTKLEAKCSVMKEQYTEQLKKTQDLVMQEKEKYRQDITKLHAQVKRLEIKASSLETALKQKTEECQQLSSLCDDITGKPM